MPAAQLPNVGLWEGWILGFEPWGDEMNLNLRSMDALIMPRALDKDLTAPPGSPATGAVYIVGASPTGAWATHAGKLTRYSGTAWEFYTPKSGWNVWVVDESAFYVYSGSAWAKLITAPFFEKQVACSDLATVSPAVGEVGYFRAPFAGTLTEIRISLRTAQTGGSLFTVDVKKNGTSLFTTLLTIDNGAKTSETATTPAVLTGGAAWADDDEITIHVTQVGDGTALGLICTFIGQRT